MAKSLVSESIEDTVDYFKNRGRKDKPSKPSKRGDGETSVKTKYGNVRTNDPSLFQSRKRKPRKRNR